MMSDVTLCDTLRTIRIGPVLRTCSGRTYILTAILRHITRTRSRYTHLHDLLRRGSQDVHVLRLTRMFSGLSAALSYASRGHVFSGPLSVND